MGRSLSSTRRVTVGMPQGSILGPLLFLVYINDIYKCFTYASMALFADDAALSYLSSCQEDLELKLNIHLKNVACWLEENKLTLHISKSKFMHIADSRKLKDTSHLILVLSLMTAPREAKFKYLGIVINDKLSWADLLILRERRLIKDSNGKLSWADHIDFARKKINHLCS